MVTERRDRRGLAFPIDPELLLMFAKGLAFALGSGTGGVVFAKLRQWATRKPNTNAKLADDQGKTPLAELPETPSNER